MWPAYSTTPTSGYLRSTGAVKQLDPCTAIFAAFILSYTHGLILLWIECGKLQEGLFPCSRPTMISATHTLKVIELHSFVNVWHV